MELDGDIAGLLADLGHDGPCRLVQVDLEDGLTVLVPTDAHGMNAVAAKELAADPLLDVFDGHGCRLWRCLAARVHLLLPGVG